MLTLTVRRCPPFDVAQLSRPNASQASLRFSHITLDGLFGHALLSRFHSMSLPHDLEYIPLVCFGRLNGIEALEPSGLTGRPRIGRFTILPTAWTIGEGIRLKLRQRLCGAKGGVPHDGLPWALLSTEAPAWWPGLHGGDQLTAVLHSQRVPPGDSALQVLQVPYPTTGYWDKRTGFPEAPPLAARTALAAVIASVYGYEKGRGTFPISNGPLRQFIHEECASVPAGVCLTQGFASMFRTKIMRAAKQLNTSGGDGGGGSGGSFGSGSNRQHLERSNVFGAPSELYVNSRFCMQPWGDTGSRKGFWDSLLSGCIPVVFTAQPWNQTSEWFVRYPNVSVLVPLGVFREKFPRYGAAGAGGVLNYLASIPQATVRRLHHNLMRSRGRAQYSPFEGTPGGDAVDATVRYVAAALDEVQTRHLGQRLVSAAAHAAIEEWICTECQLKLFDAPMVCNQTNASVTRADNASIFGEASVLVRPRPDPSSASKLAAWLGRPRSRGEEHAAYQCLAHGRGSWTPSPASAHAVNDKATGYYPPLSPSFLTVMVKSGAVDFNESKWWWGTCDERAASAAAPGGGSLGRPDLSWRWEPAIGDAGCNALRKQYARLPHVKVLVQAFCEQHAGVNILFVGDSIQGQLFTSFASIFAENNHGTPHDLRAHGNRWEKCRIQKDYKLFPHEIDHSVTLCAGRVRLRFIRNEWLTYSAAKTQRRAHQDAGRAHPRSAAPV